MDDDPVIEVKKVEGHVRVPVFVCRYKLVGSSRSAKIWPYLDSDGIEVNGSNFTEDNVMEADREKQRKKCNGNIQKSELNPSPAKRINIYRSLKKDAVNLEMETGQMKHVKTKASEAMLGHLCYVRVKKLNLDVDGPEFIEDGVRPSSPDIPLAGIWK